jgi:parvulin-like peptidyl-prolyl isomerase
MPGRALSLVACLIVLLVVACSDAPAATAPRATDAPSPASLASPALPPAQVQPDATATSVPATPTPEEPLAATVNGEPIYLSTFEEALARQQQGQSAIQAGAGASATPEAQVLDMLIERALIEQAAAALGVAVTPAMVEEKMAELRRATEETGGAGSFEAWLQANQLTEAAFQEALTHEMLAERVASVVTADVPYAVKQVRARYIQVDDGALASSLKEQLADGADFATLAREYSLDRATGENGGDLGYFAAGTLLVPEIEERAFALQPGEISDVIAGANADGSQTTYYLVQVVDVDPERPLNPDLRAVLLEERFESWLAEQWSKAEIVRFIDTEA